jgi:hypothetical protein
MTIKNNQFKCDICGKKSKTWGRDWWRYGSIEQIENCPAELPMACSDACRHELNRKIQSKEFVLPILRNRGYYSDIAYARKGY